MSLTSRIRLALILFLLVIAPGIGTLLRADVSNPPVDHDITAGPVTVDAVAEPPGIEIGKSSVVDGGSSIGTYRITGPAPYTTGGGSTYIGGRMAWFFTTSAPGDLIKFTATFPDNDTRITEVFLLSNAKGTFWAMSTLASGYISGGGGIPISNTLKTQTFYFYTPAASPKFAITFMDGSGRGNGGAVKSLTVEKMASQTAGIPLAPPESTKPGRRKIGLFWEDTHIHTTAGGHVNAVDGNFNDSPTFGPGWDVALTRHINYMKRLGLNQVYYPEVWYYGSFYTNTPEWFLRDPGRHPVDYDIQIATRLAAEGMDFWPTVNNWHLPSLDMWVKPAANVQAGTAGDYVNTVTKDGKANMSTDWTSPAVLNALHPRVQRAFKNIMTDIASRLACKSSFKGVAVWIKYNSGIAALGGEDTSEFVVDTVNQSYDDYTVNLFAQENGLAAELQALGAGGAGRFAAWYTWLHDNHWNTWRTWRKQKITQLWNDLAAIIAAKKPGAKLQLLFQEPQPIIGLIGDGTCGNVPLCGPLLTGVTDIATWLENGAIDLGALAANPNIVITRMPHYSSYEIYLRTHPNWETDIPMQQLLARRQTYFDPTYNLPFPRVDGGISFDTYYEGDFDVQKLPKFGYSSSVTTTNMFPSFFSSGDDASWHVTEPQARAEQGMEVLAKSLWLWDVKTLAQGGYNKGFQTLGDVAWPFAAAFTSLPAVDFTTQQTYDGGSVVLRRGITEGIKWYYLINGSETARTVSVDYNENGTLTNLATGAAVEVQAGTAVQYALNPYELLAWKLLPAGGSQTAPPPADGAGTCAVGTTLPAVTSVAVSPDAVLAGQPISITVNGTNFEADTARVELIGPRCPAPADMDPTPDGNPPFYVYPIHPTAPTCTVNNSDLTTRTATQLAGALTLGVSGSYSVRVRNAQAIAAVSNAQPVAITVLGAAISGIVLNPNPPVVGYPATITVNGTYFDPAAAQILLTGPGCSPCTISNAQLTTKTATSLVASRTFQIPGTFAVAVQNGAFPPSSAQNIVIPTPTLPPGGSRGGPDTTLTGYWRFNETSGTSAADFGGNGSANTLALRSPGASFVTDGSYHVLNLNGTSGSAGVASNSNLNLATGDFTITAWIKTSKISGHQMIVGKRGAGALVGYDFRIQYTSTSSNQLALYLMDADDSGNTVYKSTSTNNQYNDGQWHHVAVSVTRNGNLTFYRDGVADGSSNVSARNASLDNNYVFVVGSTSDTLNSGSNWFQGGIDDLRIYKRALSATEVQALVTASHN